MLFSGTTVKFRALSHLIEGAPLHAILRPYATAGVVIAGGSDGVRDSWNPYGMGDMLERATLVGLRNNFRRDEEMELALDTCTYQGAKVMEIADYGLDVGCTADFVILPGETICEAVVERPADRTVVKRGKIVARHGELAQPIA